MSVDQVQSLAFLIEVSCFPPYECWIVFSNRLQQLSLQ